MSEEGAEVEIGAARGRWWPPSVLSWCFIAVLTADAATLLRASGIKFSSSDAAGNAMSDGLQAAFVGAAASVVGVVALLFLVIPNRLVRIALSVLLAAMAPFFMELLH